MNMSLCSPISFNMVLLQPILLLGVQYYHLPVATNLTNDSFDLDKRWFDI